VKKVLTPFRMWNKSQDILRLLCRILYIAGGNEVMAIHEECGVFGVMGTQKGNVAGIVYYGLYALQHRGQESCGIVVNDDGVFSSYKDL